MAVGGIQTSRVQTMKTGSSSCSGSLKFRLNKEIILSLHWGIKYRFAQSITPNIPSATIAYLTDK